MGLDEITYKVMLVMALLALAGLFITYKTRETELQAHQTKYDDYWWVVEQWQRCETDKNCTAAIVFHNDAFVGGSSGFIYYDEWAFNYTFLNRTQVGYVPVYPKNG